MPEEDGVAAAVGMAEGSEKYDDPPTGGMDGVPAWLPVTLMSSSILRMIGSEVAAEVAPGARTHDPLLMRISCFFRHSMHTQMTCASACAIDYRPSHHLSAAANGRGGEILPCPI